MNNLRIERGTVLKITPVVAATVYLLTAGHQDTVHHTLAAAEELVLGPYLNAVEFRIESVGAVTIANQAVDFQTPVSPFNYAPAATVAAAVADATSTLDVVAQVNALLASMRAAGQLASS